MKKGNRDVLGIFGFVDADCVNVSGFALCAVSVPIGQDLTFSFKIQAKKETKVQLEYDIDSVESGGKYIRKIFQISEISLSANQEKTYTKAHSFAGLSSTKHCPGTHSVTLIVNGTERGTLDFEVLAAK